MIAQAENAGYGAPLPKALQSKPDLPDHLTPVWSVFWALCSDRNIGFGLSAIFTSAITSYLDEIGVTDREDRLYYLSMIRAMDLTYLKLHNEKQKAESGNKKP